jgi:hypothetical protein
VAFRRHDGIPRAPWLEKGACWGVALGVVHAQLHLRGAGGGGHPTEVGEDAMLHAAAEHAAAQEERVEAPLIGAALGDDEPDEPVVAEAIADANRAHLVPAVPGHGLELGLVAADGREVELVGPERELRGALHVLGGERREVHLELQVLDEVVEGERVGAGLLPLHLLAGTSAYGAASSSCLPRDRAPRCAGAAAPHARARAATGSSALPDIRRGPRRIPPGCRRGR